MSTFLELVQDLHTECGAAGVPPTSVVNQTGEAKRLVKWIQRADVLIQELWENWKFLRNEYDQATTASINTLAAPTGIKFWDTSPVQTTFFCVLEGETDADKYELEAVEYDSVKDEILDTSEGEPWRVIIMPDNSLLVEPTPNGAHRILADYYVEPTPLAANTDVSVIPTMFHNAILGRAMIFYGNYENAPEIKLQGQELFAEQLARLENSQLPNQNQSRFRTGGHFEVIASQ
jgi:hypothetical protein